MTQSQTSLTSRSPPYTYFHLALVSPDGSATPGANNQPLDPITIYSYIHAALTRFLGIHGSAVSFDILNEPDHRQPLAGAGPQATIKQGGQRRGKPLWIRTAAEDANALTAALSQWASGKGEVFRVVGKGAWLGGLIEGEGEERERLFSLEQLG